MVNLLEQIRRILQDDMTFSVRGPQSEGARYLFLTNRSERSYLMQPDDDRNRVGRRRISYLIEVEPIGSGAKEFSYTIKTLMEYKKQIEATWRIENNETIYRAESARLNNMFNHLP